MAAIIVGDVVGIIQSLNNDFLLPQWGWWLILVFILVVSPFIAFHKLRIKLDEIQNRLDEQNKRKEKQVALDNFIGQGNGILSTLTAESWEAIDRYDWKMDEWATNVRKLLKSIGYENYWMSNPGLIKEEDENDPNDIKANLNIKRNYMKLRLQRLQEIFRMWGN